MPGGVDPHVHLAMNAGALRTSDDFLSGSLAALRGGTTALIDFVEAEGNESLVYALEKRQAEAAASRIPVHLHMTISAWKDAGAVSAAPGGTAAEMRACVERGVGSFKIYLAYLDTIGIGDGTVRKVLATAHELGTKVLVHAEDGEEIQGRQSDLVARGMLAPRYHALSRPPVCEAKAIAKITALVEEIGGPQIAIAHVSSESAMREIIKAKQKGLPVFAETCPQYLAFTADKYEAGPEEAAPYVISPPLRQKSDLEFLWRCIADGSIDFVSTDHCPFTLQNKIEHADNFMRIPNGAGGIAERLAFILSEGYKRRNITLERIIDLTSRNAASFYGLPAATGQEDFSVWDTNARYMYTAGMGASACDHSIWEGLEFIAVPVKVVLGGKLVAENWKLTTGDNT